MDVVNIRGSSWALRVGTCRVNHTVKASFFLSKMAVRCILLVVVLRLSVASSHQCIDVVQTNPHARDDSLQRRDVLLLPEEIAEAEEEEDLKMMFWSHDRENHVDGSVELSALWFHALSCSLLVSLASLICLTLLPLTFTKGQPSKVVVDGLALFGAGAMLGDTFLHQLPHAFGCGNSHFHQDHHHVKGEEVSVGLSILGGIVMFLSVEKVVRYLGQEPSSSSSSSSSSSNLVFGYLNLFSDGVHNFTDGMAMGTAFLLHGSMGGWSRTLFLVAHELPQEIGDFGILVRSGFSISRALFFNFLSALIAFAGTSMALVWGDKHPGRSLMIEGLTSGGFIYISLAGVVAEMNDGVTDLKNTAVQIASFLLGLAVALSVSLLD